MASPNAGTESIYREYIRCLNDRRVQDVGQFVNNHVRRNGISLTLEDYQQMISDSIETFPDIIYNVDLLVVQGDYVACRITYDCTPAREIDGKRPPGKKIAFAEHVFYKFEDGKIIDVHALIDEKAISEQMI